MTDLLIGGMTCAACVARVEKKLNRLDGVSATVNLATGLARIAHPPEVSAEAHQAFVNPLRATGRASSPSISATSSCFRFLLKRAIG